MEKIDKFETMTNFVGAFANEETATKTPFLFVIQAPDGGGYKLIASHTSHNLNDLMQVLIFEFVKKMKKAVKDGLDANAVVGSSLSRMCELAMLKSIIDEISTEELLETFGASSEEQDESA